MDTASITFAELYFPLILAVCCVLVFCRTIRGESRIVAKLKPFGDFVEYHIEISNILIVRILLLFGFAGFLSSYLFYDYSSLFPQEYDMEVFFDGRGLTQSLTAFSPQERASLDIPVEVQQFQEQYFQQVDSEIQHSFGVRATFFSVRDGYVHSLGHARVVAEKIDGWQNYHIKVADGELTHFLEIPNKETRQFYTRFERLPSEDDYIRLSVADLFLRHHIMLRTQYKQILVQNNMSDDFIFKLTVVGITKLTVFPWPRVSNTVYLANFGNGGLVPVAYAIYHH